MTTEEVFAATIASRFLERLGTEHDCKPRECLKRWTDEQLAHSCCALWGMFPAQEEPMAAAFKRFRK